MRCDAVRCGVGCIGDLDLLAAENNSMKDSGLIWHTVQHSGSEAMALTPGHASAIARCRLLLRQLYCSSPSHRSMRFHGDPKLTIRLEVPSRGTRPDQDTSDGTAKPEIQVILSKPIRPCEHERFGRGTMISRILRNIFPHAFSPKYGRVRGRKVLMPTQRKCFADSHAILSHAYARYS